MRWKLMILSVMASMFLGSVSRATAQVTYSAEEGKLPFTVGMGISSFSDDWGISNPRSLESTCGPIGGFGFHRSSRAWAWNSKVET
jgi:hypothetical protein